MVCMEEKVKKAYEMAKDAHQGQRRKSSNEEYIHHPFRVYELVSQYSLDVDVYCAALLHDVVEDTSLTLEVIESELGKRVRDLVEEVSTSKEDKKTLSWKRRKENTVLSIYSLSKEAWILELADKIDNARHFKDLVDDVGKIHFDSFKEKDPKKQEWYYWSLCEAFFSTARSSEEFELVKCFSHYISQGFGRSYDNYKEARRAREKHFDFFQLRTLFQQNKGKGPVVFELLGSSEEKRDEIAAELVLSLQKYGISAEITSSYLCEFERFDSVELVDHIYKVKEKSKADILFVTTGILSKRMQILDNFQQEKDKDFDTVYPIMEELNVLKEGAHFLVDGAIDIYEYSYFESYENSVFSINDVERTHQYLMPLKNADRIATSFVLETAKDTLKERQSSNLSNNVIVKYQK